MLYLLLSGGQSKSIVTQKCLKITFFLHGLGKEVFLLLNFSEDFQKFLFRSNFTFILDTVVLSSPSKIPSCPWRGVG